MPIVSCFKRLNCLFITVEVIIQPRLKNPLSVVQWTPVVGVLLLLCCFHERYSSDLMGIGNTKQKKHDWPVQSGIYIIFNNISEGTAFLSGLHTMWGYRKSSIKRPLSNKPPLLFREGKLISPPSPPSLFLTNNLRGLISHGLFRAWDWKFILSLVFGHMTSNFMCLTFSTLLL